MKSFDEWFENEMPNSHKKVGKEKIETVIYSCAESAWDYKQAEVDELQKRIDAVIEYLDGCDSCCDISKLHLIEVLQGDQS